MSPEAAKPLNQQRDRDEVGERLLSLRRASRTLDIVLRDFKTITERQAA